MAIRGPQNNFRVYVHLGVLLQSHQHLTSPVERRNGAYRPSNDALVQHLNEQSPEEDTDGAYSGTSQAAMTDWGRMERVVEWAKKTEPRNHAADGQVYSLTYTLSDSLVIRGAHVALNRISA